MFPFALQQTDAKIRFDEYSWVFYSCSPESFNFYFADIELGSKLEVDILTESTPIFIIDTS